MPITPGHDVGRDNNPARLTRGEAGELAVAVTQAGYRNVRVRVRPNGEGWVVTASSRGSEAFYDFDELARRGIAITEPMTNREG